VLFPLAVRVVLPPLQIVEAAGESANVATQVARENSEVLMLASVAVAKIRSPFERETERDQFPEPFAVAVPR
jgi:hypothetical protein